MKVILTLLCLGAIACGRSTVTPSSEGVIGQVRSLAVSAVSSVDRLGVTEICQALLQKETIASSLLNTTHQFSTSQTNCDGSTQSAEASTVTIQQDGANLVFKRPNNATFLFPEIETTRSGALAEVCASVTNLSSPIVSETEALFFTTSAISSDDCVPRAAEKCILLERGFVSGTTARVHTREWLRIVTDNTQGRIGFVNFRRKVSRSFCPDNQVISQSATLK